MALGLNYESASSGDIMPVVKFDARAGRFFRIDREGGVNEQVDITMAFRAVFDFENVEVGYIRFAAGQAPDFCMVPYNTPMPAPPSPDHKQGFRVMLKLSKECGGDVREMAATAKSFLRGIDSLHNAYLKGAKENPGKLPVVGLRRVVPIVSEGGGQKTTNYSPEFEITGWTDRPAGLAPKSRPSAPQASSPPSTGSTKVSAPSVEDDEDFG